MKKYAIYLRKSRADEETERLGDGDTLSRHRKTLTEFACRHNLPVSDIYEEIVSGESISARPQMQRLLSAVEQGLYAGVLVMEVERLARGDTMDQGLVSQTFKYSDTLIITPAKTYDPNNEFDEEYFEFGLFMSRREYKTINRRLQRGRIASVREGKFVGSNPPYGYKKYKLTNAKGYSLLPTEPESTIVRIIYYMYTEGIDGEHIGAGKIADYLNECCIPSPKGSEWTSAAIRDILTNPVYCGKIRWGYKPAEKLIKDGEIILRRSRNSESCMTVKGIHQPLISDETYNKAAMIKTVNPNRPLRKDDNVSNPLSGLIYCAYCRKLMQRRPHNENQRASLICTTHKCPNHSCFFDFVENSIIDFLKQNFTGYISFEPESNNNNIKNAVIEKTIVKTLNDELNALKKSYTRICDAFENGIYDSDTYKIRKNENLQKQSVIKEKLYEMQKAIKNKDVSHYTDNTAIDKIDLFDLYNSSTPKEKNDILKCLIKRVEYKRDVAGRYCGSLDNFELIITSVFPSDNH